MNVKGKRTTVDYVDVSVDVKEILSEIYRKAIPSGLDHLNPTDGFWYKKDGHDYHKNEVLYEKDRKATEVELQMLHAYLTLHKFVILAKL